LALHIGDFDRFQRYIDLLLERSAKNALEFWSVWGRCFEAVLVVRRGEAAGLAKLSASLEELRAIQYGVYYIVILGEYAETLGRAGRVADGLAAIAAAIARCEQKEEKWYLAELRRIEGELLHRQGKGNEAEERFARALAVARSQQTLAWELRVALAQAQIWLAAGRAAEARALVAPVWERFSEGAATADGLAAIRLIERAF
jgi:predicted ATPase